MSKFVALTYQFMFEPDSTWSHLYEFEKSLMDFLAAHGLEAELIKPIEGMNTGRILLISKIEEPAPAPPKKQLTPKQQLKKLRGK